MCRSYPTSNPLPRLAHSENQLMRELSLGQAPTRLEVLAERLGLLHGSDNGSINRLLVSRLRLGERLLLLGLALREELLLCRARLLLGGLSEVSVVDLLIDLRRGQN